MTLEEKREKNREYQRQWYQKHREEKIRQYWANPEKNREACRRRRAANLEQYRETSRQWAKANPEKVRELGRRWRAANREKHCKASRQWLEANPEKKRVHNARWRAANPEKVRAAHRRQWLKNNFGITTADYEAILAKQGGVCAICKGPQVGKDKHFHVDHDHADKQVRGLLCGNCNRAIGCLQDSPEIIEAALRYVKQHAQLRLVS